MEFIELTNEERKIILDLRERREQERLTRLRAHATLGIAARFADWLEENGAGPSYTTFVDDFGYDGLRVEGLQEPPRDTVYAQAMKLIELASALARGGE
ncbi:MAG TPA: hypothetical protein PKD55_10790 [Bellilinea sp.]|nr:hypothetical protein [Bellilinea sp.]